MELLLVFTPGIISTTLLEKIRNQHFTLSSYLKHMFLFDLFINLSTILFYCYIYRGESGILEGFYSNSFLIRYTLLNIVMSVVLALLYHFISLHSSITVEDAEKKNTKEHSHEITEE